MQVAFFFLNFGRSEFGFFANVSHDVYSFLVVKKARDELNVWNHALLGIVLFEDGNLLQCI